LKDSTRHNTGPPYDKVYRLRFTDEEHADPELAAHIRIAEKAADKLDKAKSRLPKKQVIRKERVFEEAKAKPKARLYFEEINKAKPPSKLTHIIAATPILEAHRQINRVQDENAGVEAAHKSEQTVESGARAVRSVHRSHQLQAYRTATRLEKKADGANIAALYRKNLRDEPQLFSNPFSRWQQKLAIKRQYAAAKAGKGAKKAKQAADNTKRAAKKAAEAVEKTTVFVIRHRKPILLILGIAVVVLLIMNSASSCSVMVQSGINMVVGTSYTAEDADILAAEAYYADMESGLQQEMNDIESTYPDYDEYRYDLAEIGHNPFELISYLTALYEDFTVAEVKQPLKTLFDRQYKLTVTETVEVRYRTEPDETGTDVEVPYDYHTLNVTLTNNGMSGIVAADLDTEKLELYVACMEMQGNKPYLFEDYIYAHPGPYTDYEIPPEALADADFAALIAEAEKYLGYPYVWGGSKPSTSFDCSGFVCWVLNHSGVYPIRRTNAQGIFNQSTPIAPSEAKPGDIIFFTGARAAKVGHPVTHVGIYVGDKMMLHCASGGVQYSSITTPYWTKNFYAFGRLDY
jgi:hypothetical protein